VLDVGICRGSSRGSSCVQGWMKLLPPQPGGHRGAERGGCRLLGVLRVGVSSAFGHRHALSTTARICPHPGSLRGGLGFLESTMCCQIRRVIPMFYLLSSCAGSCSGALE